MRKFKILTLTDHSGHSKENSLYALLREMSRHPQCAQLQVASRGMESNQAFFATTGTTKVQASRVEEQFSFSEQGESFYRRVETVDLHDFDLLFLRLPRPISNTFLQFLSAQTAGRAIINHPLGIVETSNKQFLLQFPELCPPIRLCQTVAEVEDFASQFDLVLKPLEDYGGKGMLKIAQGKVIDAGEEFTWQAYLPRLRATLAKAPYLAMKFLKNVSQGDKRVLVVNGQILAASLRLPAAGSWLCNVAQGGSSHLASVTPEEEHMVQVLTPVLKAKGIVMLGMDTLVDDNGKRILSELNTLSIGGFPQAEAQTGLPIVAQAVQGIFDYTNDFYSLK